MPWGWVNLWLIFIFGWTIPLRLCLKNYQVKQINELILFLNQIFLVILLILFKKTYLNNSFTDLVLTDSVIWLQQLIAHRTEKKSTLKMLYFLNKTIKRLNKISNTVVSWTTFIVLDTLFWCTPLEILLIISNFPNPNVNYQSLV